MWFLIEVELEKRGGRNFGPPQGKAMTVFMDDLSMPEVNKWGDQPTLEMGSEKFFTTHTGNCISNFSYFHHNFSNKSMVFGWNGRYKF